MAFFALRGKGPLAGINVVDPPPPLGRRNVLGNGADNLTIALNCLFVSAPLLAVTVTSTLGSWHHGPDGLPVIAPVALPRKLIGFIYGKTRLEWSTTLSWRCLG